MHGLRGVQVLFSADDMNPGFHEQTEIEYQRNRDHCDHMEGFAGQFPESGDILLLPQCRGSGQGCGPEGSGEHRQKAFQFCCTGVNAYDVFVGRHQVQHDGVRMAVDGNGA